MTLHSPLDHYERRIQHRHEIAGCILWEPQLLRTQLRRRSLEQATIVDVSMNGALVRARANTAITRGARISIGLQSHRGLVAVRSIEATEDESLSDYGVQFLWLDPAIQAFFDDALSSETTLDFEWR